MTIHPDHPSYCWVCRDQCDMPANSSHSAMDWRMDNATPPSVGTPVWRWLYGEPTSIPAWWATAWGRGAA